VQDGVDDVEKVALDDNDQVSIGLQGFPSALQVEVV
jgi:hypothetical protein